MLIRDLLLEAPLRSRIIEDLLLKAPPCSRIIEDFLLEIGPNDGRGWTWWWRRAKRTLYL
jgi:hypothetical protein